MAMAPYSVYLAGKISKTLEEKKISVAWRKEFVGIVERLAPGLGFSSKLVFLDPNTADYDSMPTEKFFGRDVYMIEMADAVVIYAEQKTGIGTSQEFLIAKYYKKPVIAISPKGSHYNRIISTKKSKEFHYIHPFLTATSDVVVEDFEEAATALLNHLSGKKKIQAKSIEIIDESRKDFERNFLKQDKYLGQGKLPT
jgi:hypothetical protein